MLSDTGPTARPQKTEKELPHTPQITPQIAEVAVVGAESAESNVS